MVVEFCFGGGGVLMLVTGWTGNTSHSRRQQSQHAMAFITRIIIGYSAYIVDNPSRFPVS